MKFINSNFWDRAIRVILGTSLITWAFYIEDLYKLAIFAVGFVILATGIVGCVQFIPYSVGIRVLILKNLKLIGS
ncbi:YgaP-like transmembrane domain [Leptospira haakeii]|uniref:YgaP-like transmembrane domain n=1 Tax=Leptospira haakeii TaxID=2023198 RepID=UPI001FAF5917|nr:YgaP-like transmembrane domain [Leptospira haakeii]